MTFPTILSAQATCSAISGTYSTGDGTDGNSATGTGPYTLTATATTFSYVTFTPDSTFTFAQLESLAAVFTSNSGGSGGGSPRLSVAVDQNGNGTYEPSAGDGRVVIYLGNSPAFTDSDATLNTYSGVNLIGNEDAGRYDTSSLTGGSPSTTYSAALATAGSYRVFSVTMIEDTFGAFPDRNLTLNSIDLCAQVPDLTITKTFVSGFQLPGSTATFEINVQNAGTGPTSGTVTVVDTPGPGYTITSISGTNWSCNLATLTCTRSDSLPAGQSFEPITVVGTVTAPNGDIVNSASVSGGGDADATNNSGTTGFAIIAADIPALDLRALLVLTMVLAALGARRLFS